MPQKKEVKPEVEETVENVEVVSGQFVEQELPEAQKVDISIVRVKTLGKTEEPPMSDPDEELQYYYGMQHRNGLVEVKLRLPRNSKAGVKPQDTIMWYESIIMVNGQPRKLAYHVVHEPSPHELFPEYFYPATQWNISKKLRIDQDHEPGWKKMVAINMSIRSEQPQPYLIGGNQLRPYHFVCVNNRYVPIEGPGGKRIDGVWVMHPPVEGSYILSYREALKLLGGDPSTMSRQRVADDSTMATAIM